MGVGWMTLASDPSTSLHLNYARRLQLAACRTADRLPCYSRPLTFLPLVYPRCDRSTSAAKRVYPACIAATAQSLTWPYCHLSWDLLSHLSQALPVQSYSPPNVAYSSSCPCTCSTIYRTVIFYNQYRWSKLLKPKICIQNQASCSGIKFLNIRVFYDSNFSFVNRYLPW